MIRLPGSPARSTPVVISSLLAVVVACPCGSAGGGEREPKPLWLVVGRAGLVKPIGPLAKARREEGLDVIVSTESIAAALAAAPRPPAFLLLVGDDQPGQEASPWHLPAKRRTLYRWREVQREQFASDAAWGDLDGDLVPEVAVGRIPARTAADVELAVRKILAFERRPAGVADLGLPVWAGSPQYGPAIDATATGLLLLMIRTTGPSWLSPWVVTGNARHPLCGWPPDQPELFTRRVKGGGLLAVLMGHANADGFFSMEHQGRQIRYTAAHAGQALSDGPPGPPMVLICCESGDFTRPAPCIAESLFFLPGGPVATIAATTESHPLTNYFSSTCLLRELGGRHNRIGRLWLAAQRRAIRERHFLVERVLRDVEGKLEDRIAVARLRRDQMLMYALLGDPAIRLKMPRPLAARLRRVEDGWLWTADRPKGAEGLAVGHRPANPPTDRPLDAPADRQGALAAFRAANAALGFAALPSPEADGPWEGIVREPGWLRLVAVADGRLHVAVLKAE